MKTVTPELETALGQNVTFLCLLWTITRRDGAVYRFTDHDIDVPYDGETYMASSSFQASAVQTTINSAASNLDISVLMSASSLEYIDMERGMFDGAAVTLRIVNYQALDSGVIELFNGEVFTVTIPNQQLAVLSLLGTVAKTNKPINERYSATCRATFGDARCKVDLAGFTTAFVVDTVPTTLSFTASELTAAATNLYVLGIVEWVTGANVGTRVEVASNNAGLVVILFRPPFPMQVGDTGNIIRGCGKTTAACIEYDNIANYRGEPFVPGDQGMSY